MRLFVSYARVDKPYCIQIVNTLDVHEIWYDQRLYAGQQWWKEILRRLDWCEGFIYLLSPDSVASDYCQREFELAKNLGRHIFPVMIHETASLPADLKDVHYVNLCDGLTAESVRILLNSILIGEREQNDQSNMPVSAMSTEEILPPAANPARVIKEAVSSMENNQYDQAVYLLEQAKSNGFNSRFINLGAIMAEAKAGLERQTYLREAEREYKQIAELMSFDRTVKLGCEAFKAFQQVFSDYDPDNLKQKCHDFSHQMANGVSAQSRVAPAKLDFTLPLLEWADIPKGVVHVTIPGQSYQSQTQSIYLDTFRISKYPVINAQYQVFLDDPEGYANVEWWQYSTYAYDWRKKIPKPRSGRFKGKERPREMVNWYDAMAFCAWLSERLGMRVTLPTEIQWQRAAQGDDHRIYPWGNTFEQSYCNTRESGLKMTTLVVRYKDGISPYGVYDMAGNVWEWCFNASEEYDSSDITTEQKRAVKGGSYVSYYERSKISFNYYLKPETLYGSIGFRLLTT